MECPYCWTPLLLLPECETTLLLSRYETCSTYQRIVRNCQQFHSLWKFWYVELLANAYKNLSRGKNRKYSINRDHGRWFYKMQYSRKHSLIQGPWMTFKAWLRILIKLSWILIHTRCKHCIKLILQNIIDF